MFKLIGLKWKKEFESLKSLHDIEIAKRDSAMKIQHEELTKKLELRENELKSKHDIQLNEATSLLKLDYQQQLKQKEVDFDRQINALRAGLELEKAKYQQELQKDNYKRLKDAMTKLHEEGNITTQFTKDIAMKMLDKVPAAKFEHKQLTGNLKVDVDAGE